MVRTNDFFFLLSDRQLHEDMAALFTIGEKCQRYNTIIKTPGTQYCQQHKCTLHNMFENFISINNILSSHQLHK